ncbi:DtxR family transcriptional regulator [Candidatus Zixiibacteriota bacterium]
MPSPLISLMFACAAGVLLYTAFKPRVGWFWRWQANREVTARVRREDALKHLHHQEYEGQPGTLESIAGAVGISTGEAAELVSELIQHGYCRLEENGYVLTGSGRSYALQVVRAHRLWERYLADETDVDEAEIHIRAEKAEHLLSPTEADELDARLGYPRYDPHGDPIPTSAGELEEEIGMPMTRWPLDIEGRIVHLEDEPHEVYEQLLAEGLRLGEDVRILDRSSSEIRFFTQEREFVVASVVAANITLASVPEKDAVEGPFRLLSDLVLGESGIVKGLDGSCRGLTRRRLLDLGFTPGAEIVPDLASPFGEPRAYLVRGTRIALRSEQADMVLLECA